MGDQIRVSRWLVGISVTILLFVSGLTVKALTWGSALSTRVDFIAEQITDLKSSVANGTQKRYTSDDATNDKATLRQMIEIVDKNSAAMSQKIESRLDRVQSGLETRVLELEKQAHSKP